jgi:hypothetical protein
LDGKFTTFNNLLEVVEVRYTYIRWSKQKSSLWGLQSIGAVSTWLIWFQDQKWLYHKMGDKSTKSVTLRPNLRKITHFCFSISASIAFCERVFSLMAKKATNVPNRIIEKWTYDCC